MQVHAGVFLAAAALAIAGASPALALPPGRAWAPTERLVYPGLRSFAAARFETDTSGRPLLTVSAGADTFPDYSDKDWWVFEWGDSAWRGRHALQVDAGFPPEHVLSFTKEKFLVWISPVTYPDGYRPLLFKRSYPEPGVSETTLVTLAYGEYGGAVSNKRRWVARTELRQAGGGDLAIRLLYSDTVAFWHQLPEIGNGDEQMCTVAPLSDYSAMVVYSYGSGLAWAIAEGDQWEQFGTIDPRPGLELHPRLRLQPSGGLSLLWGAFDKVHVARYANGVWSLGDSMRCVHQPGETFWSAWCDISQDSHDRPALAWGDLGVGHTFRDVGCIAFPTDAGWAEPEEVPGSEGLFLAPKITRDLNGDVWVAIDMKCCDNMRIVHTYNRASCSTPSITGAGNHRTVNWTLSEPAPETWWAVLRARGAADFEDVARVRAGPGLDMSWTDSSPPQGVLRYQIRRESVDKRYQWVSETVRWPAGAKGPPVRIKVPRPWVLPVAIRLDGAAAGSGELELFDLLGRRVQVERFEAGGTGSDSVSFGSAPAGQTLRPGVYFLRARDSAGNESLPAKVLVLP